MRYTCIDMSLRAAGYSDDGSTLQNLVDTNPDEALQYMAGLVSVLNSAHIALLFDERSPVVSTVAASSSTSTRQWSIL